MLYDLKNDPSENINIAEAKEYQKTVNQLSQVLINGWENVLP